jgi:hypothetical protein
MFYREEFRIARVEELTIMYAMTKKEKKFTCKINGSLLVNHFWIEERGSYMYFMGHKNCQWVGAFGQCSHCLY